MADNFSTQQQKIELQLKTVIAQTIINMPKSASNYKSNENKKHLNTYIYINCN